MLRCDVVGNPTPDIIWNGPNDKVSAQRKVFNGQVEEMPDEC